MTGANGKSSIEIYFDKKKEKASKKHKTNTKRQFDVGNALFSINFIKWLNNQISGILKYFWKRIKNTQKLHNRNNKKRQRFKHFSKK